MTNSKMLKLAVACLALGCIVGLPAFADDIPIGSDAANYAMLYSGTGGHNFHITNDIVGCQDPLQSCGNIGVGGTGKLSLSGTTVNGEVDFSAANTGQYSVSGGSGPTSVNYSMPSVTNALSALSTLSSGYTGGTNITITNAGLVIDESTGTLETVNGVVASVFNVTSYSANNATVVNFKGDGTGHPVVLNFAQNSNVNLGGSTTISGTGITDTDQILWNFTNSGKAVSLTNNGETFQGIVLALNDTINWDFSNTYGRLFGGDSGDFQFVSGANIYAPALAPTPEPGTLAMMGTGVLGFAGLLRRKFRG